VVDFYVWYNRSTHSCGDFTAIRSINQSLWSPYGIEQTIIFLPCGFFFLFVFFLSSPNLSRRRLDVCHTSTHGVAALVRISDAGLKRAAHGSLQIQDAKKSPKIALQVASAAGEARSSERGGSGEVAPLGEYSLCSRDARFADRVITGKTKSSTSCMYLASWSFLSYLLAS